MKIRAGLMAIAALAAFAGTTFVASAQQTLTLYQGAQINGRLRTSIDTGTAHVGDRFEMEVVPPYPSGDPTYQGAIISGEVTSVQRAGQGTKASLGLQFDFLRLADGRTANVTGDLTQSEKTQQQASGGHVALTTIGGAVLGNIVQKTIFHGSGPTGSIIGAGAGMLYGTNQKTNFTLAEGSQMQLTLSKNVVIRRQASATPHPYLYHHQ